MKSGKNIIWVCLLCLLITGCSEREELSEYNAVYFWRTDLRLDSTEWTFLQRYHINKVYCRYFDVVITIYITEDCMHQKHQGLAEKIVKRIRQMNETNDIKHVSEIQIDCDYTLKSRKNYYEFLKEVKQAWGQTLSTTIRLHQLSMEAPPVDYGVLMIYNTGDPRKWEERNPILDIRDVQPYLKRLDSYPLPLAAAYPVYQWVRMIRNIRIEHTVGADEILRVKEAVEKERSSLKNVIVTYHLDKDNINRYKPETYEEIYHH